ncbi:Costars domain [Cinara cedri]|uniref:Costars domain n=1 Tax=Cinara cedri TaxID=506608 RepID=A0A5E4NGX8_9HEMI|nr:Costars domain [Cinara cedri]
MSFMQDIVSKFNQQADSHSKSQTLNPFSDQFKQSRSPSPRFSQEEYGKPVAGSKTDLRGRKAKTHICREILELCTVIHDVGTYKAQKRIPNDDDDDDDIEDDGTIIVSFGELFQIYTKISDKVVGLLIAAKRRGFVYFDREILFQRRDDDVLIALLKPISEINKILKEDINQTNGVVPVVVNTESKPVEEKKKSSKTKRSKSQTAGHDDPIAEGGVEVLALNSGGDRVVSESNCVIDGIDEHVVIGANIIGVPERIVTEDVDGTTVNLGPDIHSNDEAVTTEPDMIERVVEVTEYKVNGFGDDFEVLTEDLRNDEDDGSGVVMTETDEDRVTETTTVGSTEFTADNDIEKTMNLNGNC